MMVLYIGFCAACALASDWVCREQQRGDASKRQRNDSENELFFLRPGCPVCACCVL